MGQTGARERSRGGDQSMKSTGEKTSGYPDDLKPDKPDLEVLPQSDRALAEFIKENPGSKLGDFMERFGWSYGTARHYRDKLVRRDLIHCDRLQSPYRHYSRSGTTEDEVERLRLKDFLMESKRTGVFEFLALARRRDECPGGWTTPNKLAEQAGTSHDFAVKTVQRLKHFGLVETRSSGYRTEVRAADKALSLEGVLPADPDDRDE